MARRTAANRCCRTRCRPRIHRVRPFPSDAHCSTQSPARRKIPSQSPPPQPLPRSTLATPRCPSAQPEREDKGGRPCRQKREFARAATGFYNGRPCPADGMCRSGGGAGGTVCTMRGTRTSGQRAPERLGAHSPASFRWMRQAPRGQPAARVGAKRGQGGSRRAGSEGPAAAVAARVVDARRDC